VVLGKASHCDSRASLLLLFDMGLLLLPALAPVDRGPICRLLCRRGVDRDGLSWRSGSRRSVDWGSTSRWSCGIRSRRRSCGLGGSRLRNGSRCPVCLGLGASSTAPGLLLGLLALEDRLELVHRVESCGVRCVLEEYSNWSVQSRRVSWSSWKVRETTYEFQA